MTLSQPNFVVLSVKLYTKKKKKMATTVDKSVLICTPDAFEIFTKIVIALWPLIFQEDEVKCCIICDGMDVKLFRLYFDVSLLKSSALYV